ncbi:MAG: ABC transporter substrate-binding protein [Chloroflexota bacterium]
MRKLGLVLCCVVLLVLGAAGCAQGEADTYEVGYIASQTGPYTALGLPSIDGAQLIVKQINESGGINGKQLELVLVDDKGTSTDTALAAQKLIEVEEVSSLACVTATGLSHSMVPILNDNETPGVIMSGTGLINDELGHWAFKPVASEADYIPLPLAYLRDDVGVTRIAAMIENSGYGEGGEHYLKLVAPETGMEIVKTQYFDPAATDMTPQLANVKSSDAEAMVIWGSGPAGALTVKQAREMGISLPIVTTPAQASPSYYESFQESYEMDPSLICIDSKLSMWQQLPESDPDKELCRQFDEAFLAEYGRHPAMWEAIGAQLTMFIADALERADPDLSDIETARTQVRDAMEQTENLSLFMGTYTLSPDDHYGRVTPKEVLVTFENGEKVLVKTMD